jgi:hypothetical protein
MESEPDAGATLQVAGGRKLGRTATHRVSVDVMTTEQHPYKADAT